MPEYNNSYNENGQMTNAPDVYWPSFNKRIVDRSFGLESFNFASIALRNLSEFISVRVPKQFYISDQYRLINLAFESIKEIKTFCAQGITELNFSENQDHILVNGSNATPDAYVKRFDSHYIQSLKKHMNIIRLTADTKFRPRKGKEYLIYKIARARYPYIFIAEIDDTIGSVFKLKKALSNTFYLVPAANIFASIIAMDRADTSTLIMYVASFKCHYDMSISPEYDDNSNYISFENLIGDFDGKRIGDIVCCEYRKIYSANHLITGALVNPEQEFDKMISTDIQKAIGRTKMVFTDFCTDPKFYSSIYKMMKSKYFMAKEKLFFPELHQRTNLLEDYDIFGNMQGNENRILHYPHDSMGAIHNILWKAAGDHRTKMINMTVYRVDDDSQFISALEYAAWRGIKVNVVIESRARFDEVHNAEIIDRLRIAGANVICPTGVKVHSKVLQICTNDRFVTYLSTGNFNEVTSKVYTDFGYLTTDSVLGTAVAEAFKDGSILVDEIDRCGLAMGCYVVANTITNMISEMIMKQEEIHNPRKYKPYIILKNNSFTDPAMRDLVYRALDAGIDVTLICRGVCIVKPDHPAKKIARTDAVYPNGNTMPGLHIMSHIGQFLEHSRVYAFGDASKNENNRIHTEQLFISSADLMPRNLYNRVEHIVRIPNETVKESGFDELLWAYIHDNKNRFISKIRDGEVVWNKVDQSAGPIDAQHHLCLYPNL